MKKLSVALLLQIAALSGLGQTSSSGPDLSPAEKSVAQANRLIAKKPNDFEAYNALALALSRRARETSDTKYYDAAEGALKHSFTISPDNFDGARIHVWLLLGKHEFPAALEEARKLNRRVPDDVMVYGFLADANAELGNYPAAEAAVQRMLDLRPGNLPGLTRAAYLRELFGDVDGSLELMNMALQSTAPSEVEDQAWILTQMAHLKLSAGNTGEAEKYLQNALMLFPGYHYALGNLAKVKVRQRKYDEAVQLLRQRYASAPHAENLFELAEALQAAGRADEAAEAFAQFERKSLAETSRKDNSNRELVFYYADYARAPGKALEVARREFSWRHDVFTLDCYAWALHANGQDAEARRQIESALSVGIRDAKLLRHAGAIAQASGDRTAATKYIAQCAQLNGSDCEQASEVARLASARSTR